MYLSSKNNYLLSAGLSLLLFVVGCTQTVRLVVIDADNSQPVQGVPVHVESGHHDIVFGSEVHQRDLGVTNQQGEIVADKLSRRLIHRFTIDGTGYSPAWVGVSGDTADIESPIAPKGQQKQYTHADSRKTITVPLHKSP